MADHIPVKGQSVEFANGHNQTIIRVDAELDQEIVWLKRRFPTDPEWCFSEDLIWLGEEKRWLHAR